MKSRLLIAFICFFATTCCIQKIQVGRIYNRHYKFKIVLPPGLVKINDSSALIASDLYYDSSAGIILLVSARESKFKSVNDYVDCRKETLETQLRYDYGDSLLSLVSCSRSVYYPKKSEVLNFRVSVLPLGFNSYIIYFIHHKNRDIQISFTYKKETEQNSLEYIDNVMQTLKLK